MPIRGSFMLPSTVSKTLVCIDETSCAEIAGRLYNPYRPRGVSFYGVMDLMKQLEGLFDDLAFPQAYFDYRTFRKEAATPPQQEPQVPKEVQRFMDDSIFETSKGQKATFIVQVQFRQNATWQGTIQWTDQKKTQRFRSTLEMIKLMSDALEQANAEELPAPDWSAADSDEG